MKGQIGTLVAQRQAAQAAASHAAFLARVAAAAKLAPATSPARGGGPTRPRPVLPNLPAAGGAATAVAAAESQIGVPYVWGGESPGRGFDCSGLTQWAWRQAGVDLPRTAAAQYDAIAHVPLSDLQPGDLLFWGFGGISHVGMYVGGGEIVNAPETGELVRIAGHLEQRARGGRPPLRRRRTRRVGTMRRPTPGPGTASADLVGSGSGTSRRSDERDVTTTS